jgi:hypothetical protein
MAWRHITRSITARGSLRGLARWLFLATLVITPWLYGATTAWAIEIVNGTLGLVLAIWIASLLLDRRWPMVPRTLVVIGGLILLQGWWMTVNAHAIYDSTFRVFAPLEALRRDAPGSADYVLSFAWMLRATALLGVVCLVAEIAQRPVWLLRLWYAIAIAGGSIALLGLIQKGTGAQAIFWRPVLQQATEVHPFFASYYYHANAGAFLNLVLPPAAGLVAWILARTSSPVARAIWITLLGFVAIAILSNTSRMAQIVGAVTVLVIAGAVARPVMRFLAGIEKRTLVMGSLVVVLALVAVAQAVQLDAPLRRWNEFAEQAPISVRWTAYHTALSAIGAAGLLGFGPGTFQAVFPHYQHMVGNKLQGTWRFLHQDYLQTILEWGWLGSALAAGLFFGGIALAVRNYSRAKTRRWSNRQRILLPCVVLALVGVAIHATLDFPLQILSLQLFVATYLGICWGSMRWSNEIAKSTRRPPPSNL